MKLGIGSYCYMWSIGQQKAVPASPLSAIGLLEEATRLNVDVVQFGPNLVLRDEELDGVCAEARRRGIEIELGMEGLDAKAVGKQLIRCRRLGARLLRSVHLYEGESPGTEELAATLRALLPALETHGVYLAIENARTPARLLRQALDAIASPWLGITLDTVNSLSIPEGTEEVVRHLAAHTLCLHVKDFRVQRLWHKMGFSVEGTPAGEGQLDVPWLLGQLREAGADPNAILELWVPEQPSLEETIALEREWVEQSVETLRRLIAE
ncbi:MAG: TIM barrel protein [Bryobacterales bacterium]|nr:TIM barrel protein [Bryobacterales bacterium]